MNNEYKIVFELSLNTLLTKYGIVNNEDVELLKSGIDFLDNSFKPRSNESSCKVGSALIEYLLYKMNGGKF